MEPKKYERMIELFELRRMRQAKKNSNGCDCSGCAWFERLGIHIPLER